MPPKGRLAAGALLLWVSGVAMASGVPYRWDWRSAQKPWSERANIRGLRVSVQDKQEIFAATLRRLREEDWADGQSESELREAALETRVRLVDLDGDGIPEVVELGWVGQSSGDGNSAVRILKRTARGYRVLCSGSAERVNVDLRDKARPLVVAYAHDSASEGNLTVWRVAGGVASKAGEYEVRWTADTFQTAPVLERR